MKDLTEKILEAGIENVLFMVGMRPLHTVFGFLSYTTSDDDEIIIPATIVEERYKVADDYKITVQSIYKGFGQRHFYISDLHHLILDGTVTMYTKNKFE